MLLSSRAIIRDFYRRLDDTANVGWWRKIGWIQRSDQEAETYAFLGQAPGMREWTNERMLATLRENKITIPNRRFEASIRVPLDDLRRDKTDQHRARARDLAVRAGWQHWHKLLTPLIVEGDQVTYGTSYDGAKFFDTAHSIGDSGTIKNNLTAAEVSELNVSTPTAPTQLEAALAMLGTINYMRTWNDDQGEPANEEATGFVCMVPSNLAASFQVASKANTLFDGTSQAANPLISTEVRVEVVSNPRILTLSPSDTATFYMFRSDANVKPFILQSELEPEMKMLSESSDHTFLTDDVIFGVKTLRNVGYGEWIYAARATMS